MTAETTNHADREHVELAPSAAYRWWECPGSIALSRGLPNRSSAASREGTAAHELAQLCLTNGQDAIEYIGRTVSDHEVTAEMADGVQVYLDEVRRVHADALSDARWIEHRVHLDALNPPGPMSGTADAMAYVTGHSTLYIHDLKFGARTRVEADTPQLRIYALGAMLAISAMPKFSGMPVRKVVATIVQPRQPAAGHDPIRTVVYDTDVMLYWALDMLDHAKAAMAPDAPLAAGSWCKFCPAAGRCPEQAEKALKEAQIEFGALVAPDPAPAVQARLLTPEQLGRLLDYAPMLEELIRAARAAATAELAEGRKVPGWKLAEKQGHAVWQNPEDAASILTVAHGINPYKPQEIISPAQARERSTHATYTEALIAWEAAGKPKGRKPSKKSIEEATRDALAPLTYRPLGVALVPADDPRPAIPGGGREFTALPDETVTIEGN